MLFRSFEGEGLGKVSLEVPDLTCYGIDPFIEDGHTVGRSKLSTGEYMNTQHELTLKYLEDKPNTVLHVMTSHDYRAQLTAEKIAELNIGAVLIDGNHHYEYVVNDYELAMMVIGNKAGLIVFDDLAIPDVKRAVEKFKIDFADRIENIDNIHDVALSVFIREFV